MKIILLKDVPKVGRKDEIVEASDGYARNFLIPNKLAKSATPDALKDHQKIIANKNIASSVSSEEFLKNLQKISEKQIIIEVTANEKGSLFKGVSAEMISKELKKHGFDIKKDEIVLDAPIKKTGDYELPISRGEFSGSVKITIKGAGDKK
ncbi:MAG: 50S ribosomal protein L9 [Candidatus Niyogibacteria bacterium CG10_big_fil_rev_8_21_14_0_10_42_19]|uniref:Large ribosomal subunit protein bL9 n=1 Tax=Candidatus Niyogibacteria bacterium CG10_big_fil_rev_8_21_14_0_10_42_19 TaxID=1974725 RepID=A0A2H0TET8_9BACT|nr:MAG: 50S ribosomal protein L9 [Candidatus Niyogibacteria bacterium CG10_big_fil_rev_8_21_14_0_10_42_19]